MRIFSDFRWINTGGIGTFLSSISSRIKLLDLNVSGDITSFFSPFRILEAILKINNTENVVIFLPGYIPPVFSTVPYVFTLHDLNHIDRTENSSFLKKIFYYVFIMNGCYNAKAILTVSDFSKYRIAAWSGVSIGKVFNVGNGVDHSFNNNVIPFEPGYEYFLCVSNRKRHKNELALISAFVSANIDANIKLAFTGSINSELNNLVLELGVSNRIVFLGRIPDGDLPSIYKGSRGLLFPSLYEGFGLPVVEAMACGVPVLTSNTTSLPEVAGDAALLVNPESVDEIRVGIERLVNDEALRADLIYKGLERAKLFSWDAVAERVQAVLDEVVQEHER